MNRLEEIYEKYDTDKGNKPAFPDRNRFGHEYGYFYDQYFEKYLDKNPNILEIGVFEGNSMLAHNEYFSEKCNITAIDIENYLKFDINNYKNFTFIEGDSEDEHTIKEAGKLRYDIIIDDASHTCMNQISNLINYSPFLAKDGIYIIEDLQCNLNNYYVENNDMQSTVLDFLLTKRKLPYISFETHYELNKRIKYVLLYSKTREINHMFDEERCSISAIVVFND